MVKLNFFIYFLIIVLVGGYFLYEKVWIPYESNRIIQQNVVSTTTNNNSNQSSSNDSLSPVNNPSSQIVPVTSNVKTVPTSPSQSGVDKNIASAWETYKNEQKKFSFEYPQGSVISEIPGNIALTVSIDRQTYTLYFLYQGRADDYSTYKVSIENKIIINGQQASERIFDSGDGKSSVSIELKRSKGSDGLERTDSFMASFGNINEATKALPEIESIVKTIKYL